MYVKMLFCNFSSKSKDSSIFWRKIGVKYIRCCILCDNKNATLNKTWEVCILCYIKNATLNHTWGIGHRMCCTVLIVKNLLPTVWKNSIILRYFWNIWSCFYSMWQWEISKRLYSIALLDLKTLVTIRPLNLVISTDNSEDPDFLIVRGS